MQQIRTVSIGEVQAFLQNHPGGFLIDVLPPEFHAQQHIPGSSGVCVFETAFQEKMRALVPDMAAPLLVYGAGGSLDSAVAAEKLQREGYTDISLFAGGLEAWRKAGLPLEGGGVDFPVRDATPPTARANGVKSTSNTPCSWSKPDGRTMRSTRPKSWTPCAGRPKDAARHSPTITPCAKSWPPRWRCPPKRSGRVSTAATSG